MYNVHKMISALICLWCALCHTVLLHREWNEATLQEAIHLLSDELQLPADAPGGMPEYRKSLVTSFFFKFYLTVSHLLSSHTVPEYLHSATQTYHRCVHFVCGKLVH